MYVLGEKFAQLEGKDVLLQEGLPNIDNELADVINDALLQYDADQARKLELQMEAEFA